MAIEQPMTNLLPSQIAQFLKRFRFQGGTLRRFRVHNHSTRNASGEVIVAVSESESNQRVLLRVRFDGVEEYRFQRRPGPALVRLKEVRLGVFDGVFYLNLDAFADDGRPALHDFRASDAFIAGRSLSWEIIPPKSTKSPAGE
jgi:hypothetical protein